MKLFSNRTDWCAPLFATLAGIALLSACTTEAPPSPSRNPSISRPSSAGPSPSAGQVDPTGAVDSVPAVRAQGPPLSRVSTRTGRAAADFNGDGYTDLAVSKRQHSEGDVDGSYGLVQVLYGSPRGFQQQASQQWSRAEIDVKVARDSFGSALAHGDIDADGYTDLIVGDPGMTLEQHDSGEVDFGVGAGDVHIVFGSATGLSRARVQIWSLDTAGIYGRARSGDAFGAALAVGDFGRGSSLDLAIGMPAREGAGAVLVLYGGSAGLSAGAHQVWVQGTDGIAGRPERGDDFGQALATGDFDGNGSDELVVGVRYDRIAGVTGAGSIHVLRGTSEGLTANGAQHWTPGRNGLLGQPTETALFGHTFAVGAFTGGDHLDLAVGSPGWNSIDTASAGAVHVLYGSSRGLSARNNQDWTEYDLGTRQVTDSEPEDNPSFGSSLAAANFGRGPADDLAIGIPEGSTHSSAAGAVQILYGTRSGLRRVHSRQISQDTRGIKGFDNEGALFGSALAVVAATGWGEYPTLVVGAPAYGGLDDDDRSGIVHLIRSSAHGLTTAGDTVLTADQFPQRPTGENFGGELTG